MAIKPDSSLIAQSTILAIGASQLGGFGFERDEYFAHVAWPGGSSSMPVDVFLRAMMRDVAWGFFYGTVNFDNVFGTTNHYGTVDMFAGLYNAATASASRQHVENFKSDDVKAIFKAMLDDWTNEGFDPFAAPQETGTAFGPKHGNNTQGDQAQAR